MAAPAASPAFSSSAAASSSSYSPVYLKEVPVQSNDYRWDDERYIEAAALLKRAVVVGDCLEYKGYDWQIRFDTHGCHPWAMHAHQVAWKLAHRDIPSRATTRLLVTQNCGNKLCIKVEHLIATQIVTIPIEQLPKVIQDRKRMQLEIEAAQQASDDRIRAGFARTQAMHDYWEANPRSAEEDARIFSENAARRKEQALSMKRYLHAERKKAANEKLRKALAELKAFDDKIAARQNANSDK